LQVQLKAKTKMTAIVLSGSNGHTTIEGSSAGYYRIQGTAIGFASDPRTGIFLTADQNAVLDWTTEKQMVCWADIPIYQEIQLMPDEKGNARFVQSCGASCHGFRQMID
jgi:hypothetical protein